jgi:hypothetical protein
MSTRPIPAASSWRTPSSRPRASARSVAPASRPGLCQPRIPEDRKERSASAIRKRIAQCSPWPSRDSSSTIARAGPAEQDHVLLCGEWRCRLCHNYSGRQLLGNAAIAASRLVTVRVGVPLCGGGRRWRLRWPRGRRLRRQHGGNSFPGSGRPGGSVRPDHPTPTGRPAISRDLRAAADYGAVGEHVVIVVAPLARWAACRGAFEDWAHLNILASACRPASVIRTRATSICRPRATMRSRFVVARPALTSSTIMSIENPCARRIVLV